MVYFPSEQTEGEMIASKSYNKARHESINDGTWFQKQLIGFPPSTRVKRSRWRHIVSSPRQQTRNKQRFLAFQSESESESESVLIRVRIRINHHTEWALDTHPFHGSIDTLTGYQHIEAIN